MFESLGRSMRTSRLILAALVCACGPPASVGPAPASGGGGTGDLVELEPWLTALRDARASESERRALIRELDPGWEGSDAAFGAAGERCEGLERGAISAEVLRLDAQLDDDIELETIVRVTTGLAPSPPTERCEHGWLGLFDPAGSRHRFRGALRVRALHCLDDREERESVLTVRSDPPILELQRVASCGTLVDYAYTRYRLVLREDGPGVLEAGTVEGRRQDRLADLAQADPSATSEPARGRDTSTIAASPISAPERLRPCQVVLRHTTYDERSRSPTTQTLTIRRLVRRWTDDLREGEWHDVAPIPLTLAQARALLPEPTELTGQRGVEVLATVGDGQLSYRFDARRRTSVVDWDPVADSSTYEYRYAYECRSAPGPRPFYADDRGAE